MNGRVKIRVDDGNETRWIIKGPEGAVDFHCFNEAHDALGRAGGVEYHWRSPRSYMRENEPHHQHCWVLNGPCWHDGTSLYATEHMIPLLERLGEDAVWLRLLELYELNIAQPEESE